MDKLDPDNYDPKDYKVDQKVIFKEKDGELVEAIITYIDYINGSMSVEFVGDKN